MFLTCCRSIAAGQADSGEQDIAVMRQWCWLHFAPRCRWLLGHCQRLRIFLPKERYQQIPFVVISLDGARVFLHKIHFIDVRLVLVWINPFMPSLKMDQML